MTTLQYMEVGLHTVFAQIVAAHCLVAALNSLSGANGSESLCRDGTKTRGLLQWMY